MYFITTVSKVCNAYDVKNVVYKYPTVYVDSYWSNTSLVRVTFLRYLVFSLVWQFNLLRKRSQRNFGVSKQGSTLTESCTNTETESFKLYVPCGLLMWCCRVQLPLFTFSGTSIWVSALSMRSWHQEYVHNDWLNMSAGSRTIRGLYETRALKMTLKSRNAHTYTKKLA
jgi:hypothetical protein